MYACFTCSLLNPCRYSIACVKKTAKTENALVCVCIYSPECHFSRSPIRVNNSCYAHEKWSFSPMPASCQCICVRAIPKPLLLFLYSLFFLHFVFGNAVIGRVHMRWLHAKSSRFLYPSIHFHCRFSNASCFHLAVCSFLFTCSPCSGAAERYLFSSRFYYIL